MVIYILNLFDYQKLLIIFLLYSGERLPLRNLSEEGAKVDGGAEAAAVAEEEEDFGERDAYLSLSVLVAISSLKLRPRRLRLAGKLQA